MNAKKTSKSNRKSKSTIAAIASRTLLDSKRLLYFYHVAKAGGFTAAEAQLDVAQSTMTRQIQQLESDIGVQLLQRTGRGVVVTPCGQILYRHAEPILNGMAEAVEEIDMSQRNPTGQLSVAAPPSFSMLYMPEIIRRLLTTYPTIRLTVLEASTGQVHEHLASGEVDVAVVLIPPNTQKMVLKKVSSEPLCLIVHANHSLASAELVDRKALASLECILPAAMHGSRTLIEKYFLEGGMNLDSHMHVDSLSITKALIGQGTRFCSILPERSCQAEIKAGLFKALPLTPTLKRTLYLARLRDRSETPYIKVLSAVIAAVLRDEIGLK